MSYEDVKNYINNHSGFIKHNNMEVINVTDGYAEVIVKTDENSLNPNGTVHGGLLFGLCNTVCGLAAFRSDKVLVTMNATIDYLRPATGGTLKAISECIRNGRTVSVYEGRVFDEFEKLVARSTVTIYYNDVK